MIGNLGNVAGMKFMKPAIFILFLFSITFVGNHFSMAFESGISGLVSGLSGISGRCCR